MVPKIKICGITNAEDAQIAVEAGADALGFIFYPNSPRFVDIQVAKSIVNQLPPFVLSIGVFVNEKQDMVQNVADVCGLSLVQLHGEESPGYCESLGLPVLKAIRLRDRSSFLSLAEYKGRSGVRGFVIDAFSESEYGGTGKVADWNIAAEAAQAAPILLAGGLSPANVQEAIQKVQPYGVDVSSGVEVSPGKKDPSKVHDFIRAAKLVS